jgi:hypothetical protein
MNMLGVRVVFRDVSDPGVLIRFYAGRAIDVESVRAEKALGGAQAFFGALNIAIRRAGLPPRPATSGSGLGPRG